MIAVIDYGMGNIGSILNMFHKIGEDAVVTADYEEILRADKLVLPGVGSFDNGMKNLNSSGLSEVIRCMVLEKKKPILGICLGMQLLGKSSEEGSLSGLGLIPFKNNRFFFDDDPDMKIPHMGWDIVTIKRNDPIFEGVSGQQRFYFVHSYHAVCEDERNCLMTCEFGYPFAAAVKKDTIYGVQFHPEKSHKYGMKLLENYARRV